MGRSERMVRLEKVGQALALQAVMVFIAKLQSEEEKACNLSWENVRNWIPR